MRVAVLVMLFSCFPSVRCQTPVGGEPKPEAQLSPQAGYDQRLGELR